MDIICFHKNLDLQNGFCKDCKIIVTDGTAFDTNADYDDVRNVNRRKRTENVLFPDRSNIKLPDYIIDTAENISRKFNIKGNRDDRLIRRRFACLFYACMEDKNRQEMMGNVSVTIMLNPIDIAGYVGMDVKQISKALTDFSAFHTGYMPAVTSDAGFQLRPCTEIAISKAKALHIPTDYFLVLHDIIENAMHLHGKELDSRTSQTIAAGAIEALLEIYPSLKSNITKRKQCNSTAHAVADIIVKAYNA